VSIEFDDGHRSALHQALPQLTSRGWRPTMFAVSGTPDPAMGANLDELMDAEDLRTWAREADVGSHSVSHRDLTAVGEVELHAELIDSRRSLESAVGRPVELFAAPFGLANALVEDAARASYRAMRILGGRVNVVRDFDPVAVHGYCVKATTTHDELQAALRRTRSRRGWLVLVWHRIDDEPIDDWTVSARRFAEQLDLIDRSGLKVLSTSDALDRVDQATSR